MAKKLPFLARLLEAMRAHGEQSEPDMEVGDLQQLVRDLWSRLPKQQQVAVANDGQWRDLIAMWLEGDFDV